MKSSSLCSTQLLLSVGDRNICTHTHTHTHARIKIRIKLRERQSGEEESVRRDFSATSMINISPFFILLERLRNNFPWAFTHSGIKSSFSFSLLLLQSCFIFTLPQRSQLWNHYCYLKWLLKASVEVTVKPAVFVLSSFFLIFILC